MRSVEAGASGINTGSSVRSFTNSATWGLQKSAVAYQSPRTAVGKSGKDSTERPIRSSSFLVQRRVYTHHLVNSVPRPTVVRGQESAMEGTDLRRRLLAILAADAVGYSRLMSLDDQGTVHALEAARGVFRDETSAYGGRVIDTAGDSVLAVFDTAFGAVSAAMAAQRRLSQPPPESRPRECRCSALGAPLKTPIV